MAFDIRAGNEEKQGIKNDEATDRAVRENWYAYTRARDAGHTEYVEMAKRCDAYYRGEQWEKSVADELESEGRPYLTINQVLSTVNAVQGQQISTRQEISFAPRGKGASDATAKSLSAVVKQIQHSNNSQWNEQQVFSDGIIEDRGYFDMRIDFSDNIYGEVRETVLDPRDVLLDEGAKEYNPATWKQVILSRWFTPDELEVYFGKEKADRLRSGNFGATFGHDSVQFEIPENTFGDSENFVFVPDTHEINTQIKRVRVIERQHKKVARTRWFVDVFEGDMRRVPDNWSDGKVAVFAAQWDLELIEKPELRVRWTITADDVMLFDDWSHYDQFTIFPYFPYFRRGRPFGLVRNLLSPQDMLNKITSQELHVVNTTANSGWVFQSGSLINMDADELQKVGAKTGLVLEYAQNTNPPEKIQPNNVPAGLDHIASKAQLFFNTVSGLPEGFFGRASREVSGVAMGEQREAGIGQLEVVFDNLAKTRQYRAEFILKLIQQFYTEERMVQITELDEDGNEQTQEIPVNQLSPEGEIVNDLTLGEYSVAVASVPHHETIQDSIWSQLIQMREAGVTIPDHIIIDNSRLPNKNEVSELVKNLQGMAEPTPEEVERDLQMQDLQLASIEADVREKIAQAMEREANAQKLLAEAETEQQAPLLEAQKMGAQLRHDMEKIAADLRTKREELQARLIIAREKNDTSKFEASSEAMVKRLDSANRRETDKEKIKATKAAGNRSPKGR